MAVRKANAPAPVAVYDAKGNLVGVVMDPEKITPISDGSGGGTTAPAPAADAAAEGVAKLRKGLYGAATTEEQNQIASAMQRAAIVGLRRIHRRPAN